MRNNCGCNQKDIMRKKGGDIGTASVFAHVEPVSYGSLTKEQFSIEIEKGMEDIKAGRVYSADEVEAEME